MRRGTTMRLGCLVVLAAWVVGGTASAAPIALLGAQYADLGVTGVASVLTDNPYDYNHTFTGQVLSRAYTLDNGKYLYLYQVQNAGPSSLEVFGVAPFFGLEAAGYLTAGEPAEFLSGGHTPAGGAYDATLASPLVTFGYPGFMDAHVPAGQWTSVLYLISPFGPTLGEAYVIDGGVAVTPVIVPLPEPAALSLMAAGLVMGVVGRIRRRR